MATDLFERNDKLTCVLLDIRTQENARLEEMHMAKIRERIAYLEAQEQAAQEKRERRNQLMRSDLNTQVFTVEQAQGHAPHASPRPRSERSRTAVVYLSRPKKARV